MRHILDVLVLSIVLFATGLLIGELLFSEWNRPTITQTSTGPNSPNVACDWQNSTLILNRDGSTTIQCGRAKW